MDSEIARIKQDLSYNRDTGCFTWNPGTYRQGTIAGTTGTRGYRSINVGGKTYKAHRLAWLFAFGEFPSVGIDHINGDTGDNRIANLRACDQSQNSMNRKPRAGSRSGLKGVSWHSRSQRWRAQICKSGKNVVLGQFKTAEEAHAVYCAAARVEFGEFFRAA